MVVVVMVVVGGRRASVWTNTAGGECGCKYDVERRQAVSSEQWSMVTLPLQSTHRDKER